MGIQQKSNRNPIEIQQESNRNPLDPIGFKHKQLDSLDSLGRNPTQLDLIGSIGFSQIQLDSISSIALNRIQSDWVQGSGFRVRLGSGFRVQWIHLDEVGPNWIQSDAIGFKLLHWIPLDSIECPIGCSQVQLDLNGSITLNWIQSDSSGFNWFH